MVWYIFLLTFLCTIQTTLFAQWKASLDIKDGQERLFSKQIGDAERLIERAVENEELAELEEMLAHSLIAKAFQGDPRRWEKWQNHLEQIRLKRDTEEQQERTRSIPEAPLTQENNLNELRRLFNNLHAYRKYEENPAQLSALENIAKQIVDGVNPIIEALYTKSNKKAGIKTIFDKINGNVKTFRKLIIENAKNLKELVETNNQRLEELRSHNHFTDGDGKINDGISLATLKGFFSNGGRINQQNIIFEKQRESLFDMAKHINGENKDLLIKEELFTQFPKPQKIYLMRKKQKITNIHGELNSKRTDGSTLVLVDTYR